MATIADLYKELERLEAELAQVTAPIEAAIDNIKDQIYELEQANILQKHGLSVGDLLYITDEWNNRQERSKKVWRVETDRLWEITGAHLQK